MTEPMTDARLAQIEALAAAATLDLAREIEDHRAIPASVRIWSPTLDDFVADFFHNRADAEFYFAARTAVPELIAEVRRLRAENSRLHTLVDGLTDALKEAETHAANLRKQLEQVHGDSAAWLPYIDTPRRVVTSMPSDEVMRLRDTVRRQEQRLTELTLANQQQDARVGDVDIFQADGAA